jgi:PAS domain S-box-containing protein
MSPIPPDQPQLSESGVLRLDSAMRPEARYRALVETLPDVLIVLFDRDLRILSVEGGGIDQLPMPVSELIGKCLDEVGSPDQVSEVEPHYRAALRGEDSQFDYEFANGTTWWIQVIPMIGEDGRIRGGMSHWRDVTRRVAAEREVAAYARDLERSNAELEQFAYVASHDLSEPLRMINGYLKLLRRRYRDSLDDDAQQFIDFAMDGAVRMRALIDDLLEFSRVGREEAQTDAVDLQELVEATWRVLTAEREGPAATLLATGLPVVMGDAGQLGQAFQNLLANALKFVEPGHAPVVELHSTPLPDGGWRIVVEDEGIGFAAGQAERMFRVFQRLHTRDEFPGTGVGLAITRKVIEGHGGSVSAEPRPGGGARFCIDLPVTAA